jgi:hypothetical protein
LKPRVAIIASLSANGEQGGAERFFVGLRDALLQAGLAAEIVEVYNDESDFQQIKKSYLRFYDLELGAFDGIISAKAPSYVARHPNHVCYLMHTIRVFYDMFESTFSRPTPQVLEQRQLVHALDTAALRRVRRVFAIGEETEPVQRARCHGDEASDLAQRLARRPLRLFFPSRTAAPLEASPPCD